MSGTIISVPCCDDSSEDQNQSVGSGIVIAPGATEIIDTLPTAYRCALYFLCAVRDLSLLPKTMQVKIYRSDTQTREQVFSRNSGLVNIEVNSQIVAGGVELTVKNNEAVNVSLSFIKEFI